MRDCPFRHCAVYYRFCADRIRTCTIVSDHILLMYSIKAVGNYSVMQNKMTDEVMNQRIRCSIRLSYCTHL